MEWRSILAKSGVGLLWAGGLGVAGGLVVLGGVAAFAAGTTVELWGTAIHILEILVAVVLFCAGWLVVLALVWVASQRANQILTELRNPRPERTPLHRDKKPPEYGAFLAVSAAVPIGLMTKQFEEDLVTSLLVGTFAFFGATCATWLLRARPLLGLLAFFALGATCLTVAFVSADDPWQWFLDATVTERLLVVLLGVELVGIPWLVGWLELQRPVSKWQFRRRFRELADRRRAKVPS